jgi:solute carrier family 38 (sodium-coupled neutral amino acid transporter), member 11
LVCVSTLIHMSTSVPHKVLSSSRHYNSARFYTELKDRSLPRFGVAVSSSFGIAAVAYMVIASFGFLTFGGNSAGLILNNYSPYDPLANISRVAIGISVLVRAGRTSN